MTEIEFTPDGEFNFNTVTESACRLICEMDDRGERYSPDSRYIFHHESCIDQKGIQFGTAKACVQAWLINNNYHHLNFNINSLTKSGQVLKGRTLKPNNS